MQEEEGDSQLRDNRRDRLRGVVSGSCAIGDCSGSNRTGPWHGRLANFGATDKSETGRELGSMRLGILLSAPDSDIEGVQQELGPRLAHDDHKRTPLDSVLDRCVLE